MIVYVGYAHAILIGTDKKKINKQLKTWNLTRPTWIRKYELNDELIELECD